jgi:hypothetical protein
MRKYSYACNKRSLVNNKRNLLNNISLIQDLSSKQTYYASIIC